MELAAPHSEAVLHRLLVRPLLWTVDAVAALLLAADLFVVLLSVFYRFVLDAPLEWADDVARGLMVALSFFGAAGALARSENVGVAFFVDKLPPAARRVVDAAVTLIVVITAGSIALHALDLGRQTTGQLTGSGLPLELTFYPMGVGGICMTVFALHALFRQRLPDIALGALGLALLAGLWYVWSELSPDTLPDSGLLMLVAFVVCLFAGMPIGFVLAFSALVFVWVEGAIPGVIFAQQMARQGQRMKLYWPSIAFYSRWSPFSRS